eukprot:CAMPEP_0113300254 /NCGR_PEP_ID=MMETSP0010_2-20120614/1962_1 /TAXON_ID=216773 ORGANISM="Corethron hystrix, Strain 308" /NCGR_SAMPLE_ID=MMETSP0010_2 /ASSEMBLY_ACC=CAM_ASM_000155 /LENGTH=308 /DNA_ID=CAMNT_0000153651 /DNA_START=627 /DNA_END=1553 /DNA_ORIENTATION=- /assembly_acc=CAM_ASM_000155
MERNEKNQKWYLFGSSDEGAFHDTPEYLAKKSNEVPLGEDIKIGYDAVIMTDISSSFGKWHRASCGVPESFVKLVREKLNARIPLFSAMIAFEDTLSVPYDAISFHESDVLWFAGRCNSKPNISQIVQIKDCWTLISTPEYAVKKIEETPMQDSKTGEFIPQSEEYLTTVPGPDLESAFRNMLLTNQSVWGDDDIPKSIPEPIFIDAQRWGSAMPCHRHLDSHSETLNVISGVRYDTGRSPLAPTTCIFEEEYMRNFIVDENLMLFQAGDMMSNYTPGYESAAISGIEAAEYLIDLLHEKQEGFCTEK